jgi:hypothetical protein
MTNTTAAKRAPQCSGCGCDSRGNLPRRLWGVTIALLLMMALIKLITVHETHGAGASVSTRSHLPEEGK